MVNVDEATIRVWWVWVLRVRCKKAINEEKTFGWRYQRKNAKYNEDSTGKNNIRNVKRASINLKALWNQKLCSACV